MSFNDTDIRWTDKNWNPVHGCSRSGSPGCANCYAERVSLRFGHTDKEWLPENAEDNVTLKPRFLENDRLHEPNWVFVNSMSDLYHPEVGDDFVATAYDAMADMDNCAFQVLTKHGADNERDVGHPPDNLMLGVSVGHPEWRYRIDWLRDQPAATKFVSFEPLVECIPDVDLEGIDWAIVGGESGHDRREMSPAWARNLVRSCWRQNVDVFFKQHSGPQPETNVKLDMQDGKGRRKIEEFPKLPDGVAQAPKEFREVTA